MGVDLPKGTWTAPLIGPWWPGPSTALRDAAQHWATWSTQKQELAQTLRNQRELLSQNQGKTAEDLISRYFQGEKSELDKAEKYKIKVDALNSAADEIDYLRSRLTEIANQGNKEIDDVLASKKPLPEQLAEIQAIQARCNADAAKASAAAVNKIMAATQKVLDAEGIHGDARSWAREHGFNTDDAPPPRQISKDDLDAAAQGFGARGDSGGSGGGHPPGSSEGAGARASPPTVVATGGASAGGGPGSAQGVGARVPGNVPAGAPAAPPLGSPSMPGVGGPTAPAIPATPGAPLSPASLGQGFSPGPMGQSVATGMMTGQPATAGVQSLSDGAMHAMEPG
ncbi:MAG: hypothetical protein ACLP9N_22380, partial [Mycobacterium sp.]